MLIKPISAYLKSEQTNGRGRPRKVGVERERNGRPTRDKHTCHAVYVVAFPNADKIKVGRTARLKHRMQQYSSLHGAEAVQTAYFLVGNKQDAVALEADAIAALAERYDREKREWFILKMEDLPSAVRLIEQRSTVEIVDTRGMGQPESAPVSESEAAVVEINQWRRGHVVSHMRA